MQYTHKEEINEKVEAMSAGIAILSGQIDRLGSLRSEYMTQLAMEDLTDPENLSEEAKHIIRMIAQTNSAMKSLSRERKELRLEKQRLRGSFLFTREEIYKLMDLVSQAIDKDPTSDILHSIMEELDEIEDSDE